MKWTVPALLALLAAPSVSFAEAPVFAIDHPNSAVNFSVPNSSVGVRGKFKSWRGALNCASASASSCVLDLQVDAASVDAGSGPINSNLRGGDFFDVKNNPTIRFRSTSVTRNGPGDFKVAGDFTIRGVTKTQALDLKTTGVSGDGAIVGSMSFNRKEFGMTKGVPMVKIGDTVVVSVNLKVKRTSGPAIAG
jgi:polyisoprenoid-binding protein YceI